MRPTLSLIRRELSAFFYSPIAYVVLFVFLAVTGYLFYLTLEQLTETGPRGVAYAMEIMTGNTAFWLVYLFIPPLLTMRLFAEERSSGTLEMLLTAPIRDWQVVFAKYVACFIFYVVLWLPTLVYLPILANWTVCTEKIDLGDFYTMGPYLTLAIFFALGIPALLILTVARLIQFRLLGALIALAMLGILGSVATYIFLPAVQTQHWYIVNTGIDSGPILTTYLGLALAGAMFLAIGLFISSLVSNQMIAATISLFVGVLFIAGHFLPQFDNELINQILYYVTVPIHFERNWSRGLIDTRQLVLYVSVTLFCLFLTVRSVESRRWR